GYLASSPDHPQTAFSFHLLKYFKVLNTRCPSLSVQAFVKSVCELHCILYRPSIRNQWSDAYDVYVRICTEVQCRVATALGRDGPDWRLRNACPACTYKLQDEPPLKISMQITMDGNNTQKRVDRVRRDVDEGGSVVSSINHEQHDDHRVPGDYYITAEEVNVFAKEVKAKPSRDEPVRGNSKYPFNEPTPCSERWRNLSDEMVKKMWGIYLETGLFLALCRHGTTLVMCDMIRSGELAKYPLAVINKLIDVFGPNIMCGYDIGCSFSGTANRSSLLGEKVCQNHTRFCVGSFHGHAHCRLCQLDWHPLYIEGSGLEEYEGCERAFADSNGTGRRTRYASWFHRQQILTLHFQRWDKDKYEALSRFLYNNYCQANNNLSMLSDQLAAAKQALNIESDTCFEEWRLAEKVYLQSLKKEPERDILKLEYLRTLIRLRDAEQKFSQVCDVWLTTSAEELGLPSYYGRAERLTRHMETGRRQALEILVTLRTTLMQLEQKLNIAETWTPNSVEWQETECYLNIRTYQRRVDVLEGLVVARLFELTKLNQSGTGYKLRTHIAKALRARSQAIRMAIDRYNQAAGCLSPPRPPLDPKTVLDYVYLAEFDLLRDARQDVREHPWARPAERLAAATYFKICRSKEEKLRVEVEACRLLTAIHDETELMVHVSLKLQSKDRLLAHQVGHLQRERQVVNNEHRRILRKLQNLPGYRGQWGTGIRDSKAANTSSLALDDALEVVGQEREGSESDDSVDEDETAEAMESTVEAFTHD
ncbi:hypothetical protein JB92DRAFT_2768666, partial [Gautieria morchelliformis]